MMPRNACVFVVLGVIVSSVIALPPPPEETGVPRNTSTPYQNAPPEGEAKVIWQSVFWGLFTLALQAMSLPSALDLVVGRMNPSSLLFPARASPLVCATDAFAMIWELVSELSDDNSLRSAATHVILKRNKIPRKRGEKRDEEPIVITSSIKQHPKASVVLFLGAMTQLVKIFGFQGIFWPKIIAGLYTFSYLIQAFILLLVDEDSALEADYELIEEWENVRPEGSLPLPVVLGYIALAVTEVFCAWFISHAFDSNGRVLSHDTIWKYGSFLGLLSIIVWPISLLLWLAFIFQPIIAIIVSGVVIIIQASKAVTRNAKLKWVLLLLVTQPLAWFIFTKLPGVSWEERETRRDNFLHWFPNGLAFLMVIYRFFRCITLAWDCESWKEVLEMRYPPDERRTTKLVAVSFSYLIVGGAYCAFAYDLSGSVKPGWTEVLG